MPKKPSDSNLARVLHYIPLSTAVAGEDASRASDPGRLHTWDAPPGGDAFDLLSGTDDTMGDAHILALVRPLDCRRLKIGAHYATLYGAR